MREKYFEKRHKRIFVLFRFFSPSNTLKIWWLKKMLILAGKSTWQVSTTQDNAFQDAMYKRHQPQARGEESKKHVSKVERVMLLKNFQRITLPRSDDSLIIVMFFLTSTFYTLPCPFAKWLMNKENNKSFLGCVLLLPTWRRNIPNITWVGGFAYKKLVSK